MPAQSAQQALANLRDPSLLQWYVIPLLAIMIYIYVTEINKRSWNTVFAGLAFWGMDWFNEIWNALVLHFTGFAPLWGAPDKTAFLIFVGLNIEICFMFSIAGIAFSKLLPGDRKMRIMKIPNRVFIGLIGSIFCVLVEFLLNRAGMLTWEYSWWNIDAPWLIIVIGYFHFFMVSFFVFDMKTIRSKVITVGALYLFDAVCIVLFGVILHWI